MLAPLQTPAPGRGRDLLPLCPALIPRLLFDWLRLSPEALVTLLSWCRAPRWQRVLLGQEHAR